MQCWGLRTAMGLHTSVVHVNVRGFWLHLLLHLALAYCFRGKDHRSSQDSGMLTTCEGHASPPPPLLMHTNTRRASVARQQARSRYCVTGLPLYNSHLQHNSLPEKQRLLLHVGGGRRTSHSHSVGGRKS